LGRGESRVCQRVQAQGVGEDISTPRQAEAHRGGQAGRRRGAIAVAVTLDRFDIVFAIPPRPIEVFIYLLGRGRLSRGYNKAGLIPSRHHCGLHEHPPWLGP
jgi:hypothetical protein